MNSNIKSKDVSVVIATLGETSLNGTIESLNKRITFKLEYF